MGSNYKKYQFKIDQFKSEQELHNNIQGWLNNYNMELFFKKKAFKYVPHNISQISTEFQNSIIQYALLKRFPSLFKQLNTAYVVALSQKIKEQYNGLNFSTMMNNDAYFYYICVFMTQLLVEYLVNIFIDIQIDKHLQSELYIIIVYVMIGLQVTTKNYQINHKKIINQKKLTANLTVKSSFSMSKLQSFQILNLQRISSQKLYKDRKRLKIQTKITNLIQKQQSSCVDQFRDTLKQNLYVKVLPKIPKKKIKAWQFDYHADKAKAQKQGDEKKFIFTRQQPIILKPSQQTILSHQTSASYQYFMKKNHQTTNFVNRNTKISYRPQYMMNLKNKTRQSICQNQQNDFIKKQELNGNNKINWNKIINQIKSNILPTNKLGNTSSMQDLFHSQRISKRTSHKRSQTDKSNMPYKMGRQIQIKSNQQLASGSLGFNTISVNPPQNTQPKESKQNQKNILSFLRKQRQQFVQSCEVRSMISKYSIFNINGRSVRPSYKLG